MMADSPKNVHIVVPNELRERLKARRQSHQALAGVIEDLLALVDVKTIDDSSIDKSGKEGE